SMRTSMPVTISEKSIWLFLPASVDPLLVGRPVKRPLVSTLRGQGQAPGFIRGVLDKMITFLTKGHGQLTESENTSPHLCTHSRAFACSTTLQSQHFFRLSFHHTARIPSDLSFQKLNGAEWKELFVSHFARQWRIEVALYEGLEGYKWLRLRLLPKMDGGKHFSAFPEKLLLQQVPCFSRKAAFVLLLCDFQKACIPLPIPQQIWMFLLQLLIIDHPRPPQPSFCLFVILLMRVVFYQILETDHRFYIISSQ